MTEGPDPPLESPEDDSEIISITRAELARIATIAAKRAVREAVRQITDAIEQARNAPASSKWLTLKGAEKYSGLSTGSLRVYIREGLVRSSSVEKPGATRRRRLIDRESLDAFIEAGVDGLWDNLDLSKIDRPKKKRAKSIFTKIPPRPKPER